MTVFEEHNAKVRFLQSMENKYNYLPFKEFCEANGFEVLPFVYYPHIINETFIYELDEYGNALNAPPVDEALQYAPQTAQSSCCGGGAVR